MPAFPSSKANGYAEQARYARSLYHSGRISCKTCCAQLRLGPISHIYAFGLIVSFWYLTVVIGVIAFEELPTCKKLGINKNLICPISNYLHIDTIPNSILIVAIEKLMQKPSLFIKGHLLQPLFRVIKVSQSASCPFRFFLHYF